jgi:hypothetical protein
VHVEVELTVVLHDLRLVVLELVVPVLIQGLTHTNTVVHVLEHDHVAYIGVDVGLPAPVSITAHASFKEERAICRILCEHCELVTQ